MKDIKNENLKVTNSSAYGCFGKFKMNKDIINRETLLRAMGRNCNRVQKIINECTEEALRIYRSRLSFLNEYINKGFVIDKINAEYDSQYKFIHMTFIDSNKYYMLIIEICDRLNYLVMEKLLKDLNLLNKVKVISNVNKTKRQRSR